MPNYNLNTPTARGMEERYLLGFEAPMVHPLYAVQIRTRPGAVTPVAGHLLAPNVKGAPGLHIALIDTQQPAVTYDDFYPGTNSGRVTTGLLNQSGAIVDFTDVNDPFDDTDYARFNGQKLGTDKSSLRFRGGQAGALAGRRIVRVEVQGLIENRRTVGSSVSGNSVNIPVKGILNIGGVEYRGNHRTVPKIDAYQQIPDLGQWYLSPVTGLPWTVAEVNNMIGGGTDEFGLDLWGLGDDDGVRVSAFWLRVYHCAENRKGFLDRRGAVRRGWDRYLLGSPAALSANTWYWWEISALTGSLWDLFTLGAMVPTSFPASDVTDNTTDQRQASLVLITGPGGPGQEGADRILTNQNQGAVLLETTGAVINADSQAYGGVIHKDRYSGATANVGQQITTDSSQPSGGYAGVTLTLGWQDVNTRPDRPLHVEVRSGVGAITGGGSLVARATLIPQYSPSGQPSDIFIPFDDGAHTLANGTQYHVHVLSDATYGQGWRWYVADSRSDLVLSGSGTTVAQVKGATQGGTTDGYFTNGVADTRYDGCIAFTAPPTGPTNVQVTVYDAAPVAGMGVPSTLPPRVRITWPATALGTAFGGYHVWVRQRLMPVETPIRVANLYASPFSGLTPAQAEQQLREHWLYELGWSVLGAAYAEGWDIGISVLDTNTGMESPIRWVSLGVQTDPTSSSWLVSDAAPWLNTPLFAVTREAPSEPLSGPEVFPEIGGRDHAVIRVSGQVPGRKYKLRWASGLDDAGNSPRADESILAGVRAAYISGRQMALLRCRGERAFGAPAEPSTDSDDGQLIASSEFTTVSSFTKEAGPNMPPGYVLNGSSQYITVANNALLNPDSNVFTFLLAGIFPDANAVYLSKRGAGAGYEFKRTVAGRFDAFIQGASGSATASDSSTAWFDDMYHVMIAVFDGTHLTLYRDGDIVSQVNASPGAITNTDTFDIGTDGGALFAALAPVNSWGFWRSVAFDQSAATRTSRYLLGHAGYHPTPGASHFIDLRDKRSYGRAGQLTDLAGNATDGTVVGSPLLRGSPWPLVDLQRKR